MKNSEEIKKVETRKIQKISVKKKEYNESEEDDNKKE